MQVLSLIDTAEKVENTKTEIGVVTNKETKIIKLTEVPIMDRYSNGSYVVKDKIINSYHLIDSIIESQEEKKEEIIIQKPEKSLREIDDRIMTIDDLLDNIEKK